MELKIIRTVDAESAGLIAAETGLPVTNAQQALEPVRLQVSVDRPRSTLDEVDPEPTLVPLGERPGARASPVSPRVASAEFLWQRGWE